MAEAEAVAEAEAGAGGSVAVAPGRVAAPGPVVEWRPAEARGRTLIVLRHSVRPVADEPMADDRTSAADERSYQAAGRTSVPGPRNCQRGVLAQVGAGQRSVPGLRNYRPEVRAPAEGTGSRLRHCRRHGRMSVAVQALEPSRPSAQGR